MLERNNIMPGLRQGVGMLKRDESRHLAYGVYLVSRLVAADQALWPDVQQQITQCMPRAIFSNSSRGKARIVCVRMLPWAILPRMRRAAVWSSGASVMMT